MYKPFLAGEHKGAGSSLSPRPRSSATDADAAFGLAGADAGCGCTPAGFPARVGAIGWEAV